MHKRKLIIVLLSTILLSGCRNNNPSSSVSPASSNEPSVSTSDSTPPSDSVVSSEHVITDQEQRVMDALKNILLSPALVLTTSGEDINYKSTQYDELNKVVTDPAPIDINANFTALTKITGRDSENVMAAATLALSSSEYVVNGDVYFADEELYVKTAINEKIERYKFSNVAFLTQLLSAELEYEDLSFINALVVNNDTGKMINRNGKLVYEVSLTSEEIILLLSDIAVTALLATNSEIDPMDRAMFVNLFALIISAFVNFNEFTFEFVINNDDFIESILFDFDVSVRIIKNVPALDFEDIDIAKISAFVTALLSGLKGERTEINVKGVFTTEITHSNTVNIDVPADLDDYN